MKRLLKITGTVAVANLLCFWISYGLLTAVGTWLWETYGFDDPPMALRVFIKLLFWCVELFGTPGVTIPLDRLHSEHMMWLVLVCSILNSVIWGICFGFLAYTVAKRFRRFAT
jgi:hypothetical protein